MWHQMAWNSALRQHFISYGLPLNDRWQPRKAKNKQTLQSLEHSAPSRQKQLIGVQLLVVIRASSSVVAAFLSSALTCTIQTLNSEYHHLDHHHQLDHHHHQLDHHHHHLDHHHHQLDHHHHQLGPHCKPSAAEKILNQTPDVPKAKLQGSSV